jgi:hypothetical protein
MKTLPVKLPDTMSIADRVTYALVAIIIVSMIFAIVFWR